MNLKQWFGFGMLVALLINVIRNPVGCFITLLLLVVVVLVLFVAILMAIFREPFLGASLLCLMIAYAMYRRNHVHQA